MIGIARPVRPRWLACLGFAGALLAGANTARAQPALTFSRDIAPILYAHCSTCHRPDDIAPFSLLSYADVRPRAAAIARAVKARTMPPWKPEPLARGQFVGARALSPEDRDLIERWVAGGAPEGDPAVLPPLPQDGQGWQLGIPDLVVTLADPLVLRARSPDVLRNVVIPVPLSEGRYVRGLEFHPGNNRVVHHANIRVDRTNASRLLDAADSGPGFDGGLTRAEFPDGHFLGWTPGQLPPLQPEGMAWRLEAGSDLVVQLHLHGTAADEIVQPSIGLYFTNRPPDRTPIMLRLGRQNIDIAPGETAYHVEDRYVLPVDATVYSVQPHAHYRARQVRATAIRPDGTRQELITILDWDFNWQDVYRYAEPVALPRGTVLSMQYTYDNSQGNRRNPDSPPVRVRWGQNSQDEMGDLWVQVVTRTEADRQVLRDDFGPKVMTEDAVGYETLLEGDPSNARLHEAVAAIDLSLRRFAEATPHLEAALGIDPQSIEAHYNLALALFAQGRRDEAIAHLRRVLALDSSHVAARVNLGVLLRADGRDAEAEAELRRALTFDPGNASAHTNLAGVLSAQGRIADAIGEYRAALREKPDLLEPLTSLAWILATSPDTGVREPAEALRLAERAAALAAADLRVVDTLAAAYAAAGDFERALAVVEPAASAARRNGRLRDASLLDARIGLYRSHRPYRDPALAAAP